jgi:sarcosine oxidase/L-pipecolate oxidase
MLLTRGILPSAFKFMPVLGRYILDCYENKAPLELRQKWKLTVGIDDKDMVMSGDGSRGGPPLRTLQPHEQSRL